MLPTRSLNDSLDTSYMDSELAGQLAPRNSSISIQNANFSSFFFCQNRLRKHPSSCSAFRFCMGSMTIPFWAHMRHCVCPALESASWVISSLSSHVIQIFFLGAFKKVFGIHARRIVTCVTNFKNRVKFFPKKQKGNAVGYMRSSPKVKVAIPILNFSAFPEPA